MRIMLPVFLLFTMSAIAAEPPLGNTEGHFWMTDLEAAKAKAAKEGKDILIVYQCSALLASKQYEQQVLSQEAFKTGVVKKYIPVLLEYPENQQLDEPLRNAARMVGLMGVPTICAMDCTGRCFGMIRGFEPTTTPETVIKQVEKFLETKAARDECFKKAAMATGLDKAKLYQAGIMLLQVEAGVFEGWGMFGYDDVVVEILKSDANNEAGIKIMWDYRLAVMRAREKLSINDLPAAMAEIDGFITAYPKDKDLGQKALYAKAQFYALMQNTEKCLSTLDRVIEVDPESVIAKEARKVIEIINEAKQQQFR